MLNAIKYFDSGFPKPLSKSDELCYFVELNTIRQN